MRSAVATGTERSCPRASRRCWWFGGCETNDSLRARGADDARGERTVEARLPRAALRRCRVRGPLRSVATFADPINGQCPTRYRDDIRLNGIGQQEDCHRYQVFNWVSVQV